MIASENDTQRRVSSGDSRTLEELNIDDPFFETFLERFRAQG